MCGIAGIINSRAGQLGLDTLQRMTNCLSHRGPDGSGFWQDDSGNILMGHRRLSIIDLSEAGVQPMHYNERYTIIHNGEIYNYLELKEELKKKDYSFHSQTDTEVILAAYDYWGEDCLEHFDGMFAFAIWDNREKVLFAARDRFGEKPFFYAKTKEGFFFASEIKALWEAGIPRKVNQKMLFNFITIGYTDNPELKNETFYEDIFKLPAAGFLKYEFSQDNLQFVSWWDIDMKNQQKNPTDNWAIETFQGLLFSSVKRRLRSDVPIGTSLSGGLDSSAIAAISRELISAHQPHQCFTAIFDGFEKDESQYAKLVAERFDLLQSVVKVTADDLLADFEKFSWHQEEPVGSASAYVQYKVFECAKKQGVTVLLDGQGADEILGGYHKYYKWYWQELFRKMHLRRSHELEKARSNGITEPFGLKNMIAAWLPGFASIVMERQYLLKALRHEDLTKEYVRYQSREAYYAPPDHFSLNGVLYFNTCEHGLEELLRYADRNSMAHGREVRLPFLSHELVEFMFTLPAHFKIRQGLTKWLLRASMKERLPDEITNRKDKVGFEPPQEQWMNKESLREAIMAGKKILVDEGILKPTVLNKTIAARPAHAADNYDWRYFSASFLFK